MLLPHDMPWTTEIQGLEDVALPSSLESVWDEWDNFFFLGHGEVGYETLWESLFENAPCLKIQWFMVFYGHFPISKDYFGVYYRIFRHSQL